MIEHLPFGQFELRMRFQAGINNARHFRMLAQETRDAVRGFLLVDHARRQRRQAVHENVPRILRREHAAEIFAIQHQRAVKFLRADHRAAHVRAEAADVFGQAVHREIRAQRNRPLAMRRCKGVVHHNFNLLLGWPALIETFDDVAHRRNIDQAQIGIHRRFKIHHARFRRDRLAQLFGILQINELRLNAPARQPMRDQTVRATIKNLVRHDLVAVFAEHAEHGADRGHAGGEGDAHLAAFGIREIFFEHAARRLIQPVVNVNRHVLGKIRGLAGKLEKALRAAVRRA